MRAIVCLFLIVLAVVNVSLTCAASVQMSQDMSANKAEQLLAVDVEAGQDSSVDAPRVVRQFGYGYRPYSFYGQRPYYGNYGYYGGYPGYGYGYGYARPYNYFG